MERISFDPLYRLTIKILTRVGVPKRDAATVSDALLRADLEGVESHGICRLPDYVCGIQEKRINPVPRIRVRRLGGVIQVDGDNGLGQVVSRQAVSEAITSARQTGVSVSAVSHSNHNGAASYYCQRAAEEGMVMIAMTNSPSGIPPAGGRKAFLGTNPIAFGFPPTKKRPPLIVDMSSSVVARGKVMLAAKQGLPIPSGWAIDESGERTTDPKAALKGAVLPFGGAKGSALATAIEILSGMLSGAAFGSHVQSMDGGGSSANVGHFFILIHVAHLMDRQEYDRRMDQFIEEMKSVPLIQGATEIFYPGERRYHRYMERKQSGIPISEELCEELARLATHCDVEHDFLQRSHAAGTK